jgi:hypothetical protein
MRSDHERTEPSSIERTDAGQYRTGTTIVGVRAEEGVVLAGDRRMSVGRGFTASKDVRKPGPGRASQTASGRRRRDGRSPLRTRRRRERHRGQLRRQRERDAAGLRRPRGADRRRDRRRERREGSSRETVTAAGVDVAALDSGGFELFDRERRERLLDEAGLRQGS